MNKYLNIVDVPPVDGCDLISTIDVGMQDIWMELSLVREDRDGRTSGAPVVTPVAQLGSYVRIG